MIENYGTMSIEKLEYIIKLRAHLFFNNIDIPEWANWLATDGGDGLDNPLFGYENKPTYHPVNKIWDINEAPDNYKIIGHIPVFMDSENSLISIEEFISE